MKTTFRLFCVALSLSSLFAQAQVDTSYLYGPKFGDSNLDIRIFINQDNYYYVEEGKTFSFRASDGIPTDTYYPMAGFNTSQYTQGHMRRRNSAATSQFIMNYRLLYPKSYDENYEEGYPLIVVIHGWGERGNCWTPPGGSSSCYWGSTSWNPTTNNPAAPATITGNAARLLNNDHNLLHGGKVHLDAVNLANGKLPDDPTLHSRAFPGFVLFPQNLNGWHYSNPSTIYDAIRLIRLVSKKYNIDQNRIYIHGLSQGGSGVYHIVRRAPWLFSAVLTMSAVDDGGLIFHNLLQEVVSLPIWTFQGAKDNNPTPVKTRGYVNNFRNAGMYVRHYYYPNLGHGTWNTAYSEPDFFTWILEKNKANPHLKYGIDYICSTSGRGPEMVYAKGFFAYQWEKDGEIIPGATSHSYTPTTPGTYRGRFSRVPNPGPNDWNRWSDPIVIREKAPVTPAIHTNYTTIFPNINNDNEVTLSSATKASQKNEYASKYLWYRNGSQIAFSWTTEDDTVNYFTVSNATFGAGDYTLKTVEGNCESLLSHPLSVRYATNETISPPSSVTGRATSPGSIFLSWTDNVSGEKGFELWRRKGSTGKYAFVTLTQADVVSYQDRGLEPGTEYHYKIRAISSTSRSSHAPDNSSDVNVIVSTPSDSTPPGAPQNLKVIKNGVSSITLSWQAGSDETGIKQYIIYYGRNSLETGSNQPYFTLTGLPINTEYFITVKTQDYANQLSPPSNQVIGTTYFTGLEYEHSTGAWENLTSIDWSFVEFEGKVTSFTLSPRVQEDYFNFKYNGYIYVPETAIYQFRITSDDGSMMFLNGFNPNDLTQYVIINNDGIHGNISRESEEVLLGAGPHRVVVLYFEHAVGQSLNVQYRKKNTSEEDWSPDWTTIPSSMLTTGPYTPPSNPPAPSQLTASSEGMTRISLAWQYNGAPEDQFEIYRSNTENGSYAIINRARTTSYTDTTVSPSTTYYYKIKTVAATGASSPGFSNVASASTSADNEAPTTPQNLHVVSQNYTNVAFSWSSSDDNVKVSGYQILKNGAVVDSVRIPGYMAADLSANTTYTFAVQAYDYSNNLSGISSTLTVTTSPQAIYYSKSSGNLNTLSSWGTNPDGSGNAPPGFNKSGQVFIIANRPTATLNVPLTIDGAASLLVVPNGITLTIEDTLHAKIEVRENAMVNINHPVPPEFVTMSSTSTINFEGCDFIPARKYGHLLLKGGGIKNLSEGETIVMGNLIADNVTIKGAPSNASTLSIYGDVTILSGSGSISADNAIHFNFRKNGTQKLTLERDLDLYKLTASENTTLMVSNSTSNQLTIKVGSANGGGLTLSTGSVVNIGNNILELTGAAVINPDNETGALAVSGSKLILNSSSGKDHHLYFQSNRDSLESLELNIATQANIQSDIYIRDFLKIKEGTLHANEHITLLADAEKTAVIHKIEGNGAIAGKVHVQRWINAIGKTHRYFSSPVDGLKVADWQKYIPITGSFSGSSPGDATPSMHYYNEPQGGWLPYPPEGTSNEEPVERGLGYSLYVSNGDTDILMTMSGTPYQTDIPFELNGGTGSHDGWNLLGNPYASDITWNDDEAAWLRSGVASTVYVKDDSSGQFEFYDAETGIGNLTDGRILSGQAFWVQASANPSLTITEHAKYENASVLRSNENTGTISLELTHNSLSDPAYIVLGDYYTDEYEHLSDAVKKLNDSFSLSTLTSDRVNVAINKISNRFCQKTITLNLQDTEQGDYTFSFSTTENLKDIEGITLTDHFAQTTVNLKEQNDYTFEITGDPNSSGSLRFSLTIYRIKTSDTFTVSAENGCNVPEIPVHISNTQAETNYFITYNQQVVSDTVNSNGGNLILNLPTTYLSEGENLIYVHAKNGCEDDLITKELTVANVQAPKVEVDESIFSICEGASVTIEATGTPAGGLYRWYDEEGNLAQEGPSPSFSTPPVHQQSIYQVTAVYNGCEGVPVNIFITPESVPDPEISFIADSLVLSTFLPENVFIQWYLNNEPLAAYDSVLAPLTNGTYTVLISLNGCSKISGPFVINKSEPETEEPETEEPETEEPGTEEPGTEEPGTEEPGSEKPGTEEPGIPTGIYPERPLMNAFVYPNPARIEFFVRVESSSFVPTHIAITDISGKTYYTGRIQKHGKTDVYKMEVPDTMMPGIYIITITEGEQQLKRKIVITR